jgi:hypothetical protein
MRWLQGYLPDAIWDSSRIFGSFLPGIALFSGSEALNNKAQSSQNLSQILQESQMASGRYPWNHLIQNLYKCAWSLKWPLTNATVTWATAQIIRKLGVGGQPFLSEWQKHCRARSFRTIIVWDHWHHPLKGEGEWRGEGMNSKERPLKEF